MDRTAVLEFDPVQTGDALKVHHGLRRDHAIADQGDQVSAARQRPRARAMPRQQLDCVAQSGRLYIGKLVGDGHYLGGSIATMRHMADSISMPRRG